MSTQDMQKLSSVLRSIEIIEEKTNLLNFQYTTSGNENHIQQMPIIDDSNVHLQLFFQHFEQLLQLDLKNRKSLLNTSNQKQNYWNFFCLALKESKALYDTVLYVLNSQEVKNSVGRGRLFLRFCLQNHRLGDVVQHSFMMNKIVNQFYIDECLWTNPSYMNRIIQALYQLNELRYDLLSKSQYQLDVCWPTVEPIEHRPKTSSDAASRMRTNSASSLLSMSSVDSQAVVSVITDTSTSIPIVPESVLNNESAAQSLSSVDEDLENTITYWQEKYHQLEMQLQTRNSSNNVEIQCSLDENNRIDHSYESTDNEALKKLTNDNEQLQTHIDLLKEEINNLNLHISLIPSQPVIIADKTTDFENDILTYKSEIESKDNLINELQQKYDEQTIQLKLLQDEHLSNLNEQNIRIEELQLEIEKLTKLLADQQILMENERIEHNSSQEKLETLLREQTLDFEEMKRRLVKAVCEKAELFNSLHSYEVKLEEEQSRKWLLKEEVFNCMKCNIVFGWTHHCRQCEKIFCYNCSNNWITGPKANSPQYRVCDYCNEKLLKESLMPNGILHCNELNNCDATEDVDLHFEVRAECLSLPTDIQPTS